MHSIICFQSFVQACACLDVDATIRKYNAERLVEAGVMSSVDEVGTMWHGGAHHIGYDVHDRVKRPEIIAPGMVFCIDVGIYHEEWESASAEEDNCLYREDGCEICPLAFRVQ